MEKNKRNRARNFTSDEIRALIGAVTKYSMILEDKTTDSNNWERKNETWKQIANEFNATNSVFRNEEVLRNKYDNLKKDLKKKVAYNKAQTFRTGGGTADYKTFNEDEKELLKIISLSINGLPTEPESNESLVMLQKSYTTNEEERRVKKYEAEIQNLYQAAEQQKLEHLKRMEILEIEIETKKRQLLL
ncbi:hypothetical protein ABEB36_009533 [Hypothenemus hampei]|uniref:Regulatory protein zeste n=1 Tax=Hypothenemus hampei TaxID=57062 RepID=A0ABD1EKR5_HYPHA